MERFTRDVPVILIADDDPVILHTLSKFFSKEGYRIILAHNGQEALYVLKEKEPDLLILDVRMPLKSGVEVIKEMAGGGMMIPVIVMTAYSNAFTLSDAEVWGVRGYFQKPFDVEEMNILVRKILFSPNGKNGSGS
ncbi:MAG: response regulator [Syntrophales bacterium]|nr:response regulator [Syntrophales bacterium]